MTSHHTVILCVVVYFLMTVSSASSSDCQDSLTICVVYITKDLKLCDMQGYKDGCKKTCGLCGECTDIRRDCSPSECSTNSWKINCRKTCSVCVHNVIGGGVRDETTISTTSTTTAVCTDSRSDCFKYADCNIPGWISGCRKTCNACGDKDEGEGVGVETTTSTTLTTAGTWEAWDSWTCSVTCGRGRESRTRTCTPPGATCSGASRESQDCWLQPCCVPRDGHWSDWSSWSSCSQSCGQGRRTRSRTCDGASDCGRPCEGNSATEEPCNDHVCQEPPAVPSITPDPRTTLFSAGVTVTLTCSITDLGSPPATLRWDTSRQGLKTTQMNNQRIQLEIFNLSVEDDELSVKCLASNTVSQKEASVLLRVDQKAVVGECRASASRSTWEVTGYCDITKVFSSKNDYLCQWYENNKYNIPSSFNLSLITPGRKLQRGKCGFQTKIPHDFPQRREVSRELKYQMNFNPGATRSPIINVSVAHPKAPTLTCPADVMVEGSHINCTCSTSDVGKPEGRLLLFSNGLLENTGEFGQKVIFLSRDVRREDNKARVSCLLDWARNMSADRDWTLSVIYPLEMPSLLIDRRTTANYTTNVNMRVDFTCRVNGSNVQRLELLKVTRNGSQLLQGPSTSSPPYRIQKAGCGDSGIYYCRAGNTLGQTNSTSVQLNVLCSPELVNGTTATTKQLKVTEGSQGQLTFEVIGYPAPTIDGVSYLQGESLSSSKGEPVRSGLFTGDCKQNTPDLHLATCTLSIVDAMHTDNGTYNVRVRNTGGTMTVTFQLMVDTQDSSGNDSSLSWIGLVIALLIIIVIGVLIVFFVRRRKAAQKKTSEDKKKISYTATARRNFEDPVYYNVTVADVAMTSSAASMTSGTCNVYIGSAALKSPGNNVYVNYEKKTSPKDSGESSAGTTSDVSPQDDLYSIVDKTRKSSSSENAGKPPKPAPMPKPKRSGSASRKSADDGTGQPLNDSSVQEGGDHSHPTNEAARPSGTQNTTVNEEGLLYTELDFSQHRPKSHRPLPQKEETNYAAIEFKLQK